MAQAPQEAATLPVWTLEITVLRKCGIQGVGVGVFGNDEKDESSRVMAFPSDTPCLRFVVKLLR